MKLIKKINKLYFSYSLGVILLLGVAINVALKFVVEEELDEKIEYTYRHVEKLLLEKEQLTILEPFIHVEEIAYQVDSKFYSDTVFHEGSHEGEEFRQLTVVQNLHNNTYRIQVRESILESDDLLETIILLTLLSLVLLFGILFYLNIRISKTVWAPFYRNLDLLKDFSIRTSTDFIPEESDIYEFNELNIALYSLTHKVMVDYRVLKNFSEDASHELQTPLAVIRSKIEALLEGNQLNSTQLEKIQSIYSSVNRLTRINKDLLLLTKIENQQFEKSEAINLNELIKEQLEQFAELSDMKKLLVNYKHSGDWTILCNRILLDALFNNLIGNAIKHTSPGGKIEIELSKNALRFANSGSVAIAKPENLFQRFTKNPTSDNTGLGLAISKEICTAFNLTLHYEYSNEMHVFSIFPRL